MASSAPRTVVQLVLMDETGDSYYRMRWPARDLARQRPDWRVINLDARSEERFAYGEHADLLVIYQSQDYELIPLIKRRRAAGLATLAEYNDNYYEPTPSSPIVDAWSSPLIWQSYEAIMAQGDAVILTGEGLRALFSSLTRRDIVILENHLPEKPRAFSELWKEPGNRIVMGWGGSLGHMPDVLAVLPTLRELLRLIPNLHLKFMGNETLPKLLGIPAERFTFINWGSIHEYYRFWDGVHIGFAPLLDVPYNRCRSDIKAVEMSAHGALPIVSRLLPYEKFIAATGIPSFKSFGEFASLVQRLAADPHALRAAAERAHAYVCAHRVGASREERLQLYERMFGAPAGSFAWNIGAGYHEIHGRPTLETRAHRQLLKVQDLLKSKQTRAALDLLDRECGVDCEQPDVYLARLKILRLLSHPELREETRQRCAQFPRDLRFRLFAIESENDRAARASLWSTFCADLERVHPSARSFFEQSISALFMRRLASGDELLVVGETLLRLYPGRAALRSILARTYESRGLNKEALAHFIKLEELLNAGERNKESQAQESLPEVRSWIEALRGR